MNGRALYKKDMLAFGGSVFPWEFMIGFLILQGFFSYMNDVATWSMMESEWKLIDVIVASTLTTLQAVLILCTQCGLLHFPQEITTSYGILLPVALFMKSRSSKALWEGRDAQAYLFWHTLWHISLPYGGLVAMFYLDYIGFGSSLVSI